jgi:hypothetical protein
MEPQKILNSQSNFEQKNKSRGITCNLKLYYEAISIHMICYSYKKKKKTHKARCSGIPVILVQAGRSQFEELHSEFQASLSYVLRPSLTKKERESKRGRKEEREGGRKE